MVIDLASEYGHVKLEKPGFTFLAFPLFRDDQEDMLGFLSCMISSLGKRRPVIPTRNPIGHQHSPAVWR
jgi:hypothetical protein